MNFRITEPLNFPYVALNELKNHKMLVKNTPILCIFNHEIYEG